jgi:uncharacterized protein (UPF0261 family)
VSTIYVVGTCDTKGEELAYIRDLIRASNQKATLVDVSTGGGSGSTSASGVSPSRADVTPDAVAAFHPQGASAVLELNDRGKAVTAMALALTRYINERKDLAGIVGAGGSGGTALVTPSMRALPVGVPKLMVSTVASGNVAPYVGSSDVCMMYSVTDIAGLNRISRAVLANAAHAVAGMVAGADKAKAASVSAASRPAVGLTMFGVTTSCVNMVSAALAAHCDCLVFHATGTGGQSFEKLVDSGMLVGAIDVTTTEVCDFLVGGVFPCTEDRFEAFARTKVPWVGSCGALDMVNFGAMETVPQRFRGRNLYVHNPQVTLMRTTPAENAAIGAWIAERLNHCDGPIRLLIPERGVSAIDAPDKPFYDPEADAALFNALEKTLKPTATRRLIRLPLHINDPAFAEALVTNFHQVVPRQ